MEEKIGKLETLHESMEQIKQLRTEKKSSVDASLFDTEPREPLDLHPVEFISDGTKMITAPVLLREGDKAWWRYSADLTCSVEVLKCSEPTRLRVQPIYTIRCLNGQTHDVRHSQLFITKDRATTWNRTGRITSESSLLDATNRLDAHAIGGKYPEHQILQWKNLDPSQFKLNNLQTSIKDFKLDSDSIVELKDLMAVLSSAVTGASKTGILKLPSIKNLSPSVSIRDLMMPPPTYPRYEVAKACYGNIANAISTLLNSKEFAKNAPKAKIALSVVARGNFDGIEMLDYLLRSRIPILGATDFHPYSIIMSLQVEDGMLLINKFIALAQDIQSQLSLSAHPHDDNTLFKQFITELMKTNVHSFISAAFSAFNRFLKQNGNMLRYADESIDSVPTDLIDGKAPEVLYLTNKAHQSNSTTGNPSAYRNGLTKHKAKSNFSRLKFPSMKTKEVSENSTAVQDHASVQELDYDPEELQQAEESAADLLDKIESEYTGDKEELYQDLVI
jgi:hypothetical protein